jgi:hypothetical protein
MSQSKVYERQALENINTLSKNADRLALSLRLFTLALPISIFVGILTYGLISNPTKPKDHGVISMPIDPPPQPIQKPNQKPIRPK